MAMTHIVFKLPPSGLLIRDFTIAAISTLIGLPMVKSIRNEGDKVVVEAPLGSEDHILHAIFHESYECAGMKLKLMSSPRLGKNDANAIMKFHKDTGQTVNKNLSLLEFASQVLDWAQRECYNFAKSFLASYSFVQEKSSSLILGGDRYAALQLFKVEKYEYGRDFLKDYKSVEIQIRHDKYWLALLMAGLSLTYSGFIDGELLFTTVPEDLALLKDEFREPTRLFLNLPSRIVYDKSRGISIIMHRIGKQDPVFAFLQLLSYELVKEWYKELPIGLLSQAPIQIYRVRTDGRTCTLIERNICDLAPFTRFAYKLLMRSGDSTLRKIESLLRNYYNLDYASHHSISMKLYQTVSGAYNIYSLVYELGRLLVPETGKIIFRDEDVEVLLNALTS